ncbi:MAG: VCBS repeat-containing protein [Myxococcales bacterium]|nr:VCBS repeat-containing protein [Myxococcales bacterium]
MRRSTIWAGAVALCLAGCFFNEEFVETDDADVVVDAAVDVFVPPTPIRRYRKVVVDAQADGPSFANVGDFDGDGRIDIIVSSFQHLDGFRLAAGKVVVFEQRDSIDQWSPAPVVLPFEWDARFPNEPLPADVDGDGDLDVVVPAGFLACPFLPGVGPCGALIWFEQTEGQWLRHEIVPVGSDLFYHRALLVDLDGDGRQDVISVAEQRSLAAGEGDHAEVHLFRGIDGAARFDIRPVVLGEGLGSLPVAHDIDGDGDLDLLSAEFFAGLGASHAWLEQLAPPSEAEPGGRWLRHVIDDSQGPAIQFALVPDLLGPGTLAGVGSNHVNTAKDTPDGWPSAVTLYEIPADPRERWPGRVIASGIESVAGEPMSPQAAPGIFGWGDADTDGDIDLLVSGDGDPRTFLLEQTAPGQFETWVLDEGVPQGGGARIVDLDGDGRAELLMTSYETDEVLLYVADPEGAYPLRRLDDVAR